MIPTFAAAKILRIRETHTGQEHDTDNRRREVCQLKQCGLLLPINKNHSNRIRQYLRKSSKLTFYVWRWDFSKSRRSIWKWAIILFFVLKNVTTFYKRDFFQRTTRLLYFFQFFSYSSELVLVYEYVTGNQQCCVIRKVRNYHDEVEKAIANFHASKLK